MTPAAAQPQPSADSSLHPSQQTIAQDNNSKNPIWRRGITLFIATLGLFIVIFLAIKIAKLLTDQTSQTAAPQKQITVAATDDDISNWKTYTNKQAGFSLKYPQTWRENDISGIDFGTPILVAIDLDSNPQNPLPYESFGDSIRIIVYQNPNNLTTDEFVKKEAFKNEAGDKKFDYGNYKKGISYNFNGLKGTKIDNVKAPPGERGPSIFVPNDNFIISISTMNPSATNEKILDKILSTVEITERNNVIGTIKDESTSPNNRYILQGYFVRQRGAGKELTYSLLNSSTNQTLNISTLFSQNDELKNEFSETAGGELFLSFKKWSGDNPIFEVVDG